MRAAHEWSLWSTRARVCVTDARLLDEAVARTRALLSQVDDAANRFRDDSEVSTLPSRLADAGAIRLSPMLARLLRAAITAAQDTDGAVDPTIGRALITQGYDHSFPLSPLTDAAALSQRVTSSLPAPGWRSLVLVEDVLTMPTDVRLDLGALGKALAADVAAALVQECLGCGVLVSLGGDIATAGRGPVGGWQVRVRDHHADPESRITLAEGWATATSSTIHRVWRRGGSLRHHILDPATGQPAISPWRTVTVAAPTCAEANAAATATIVMGAGGADWLRRQGVAARLVGVDGRVHLVGGWPSEVHGRPGGAAA